jgi:hypothetical protein
MADGTRRPTLQNVSETGDIEKALNFKASLAGDGRLNGPLDWVFFVLLLAGILSSVVGYVGCFSVVQNSKSRTGPLSWLCLEAGLSIIRMILWGLNPGGDGAPPLKLTLKLDHETMFLPTCNLDDECITQRKVLPLTRANEFLNSIASFAGLFERFTHPDLTLYYTLTRKRTVIGPERSDEAGKRVLYITIFDHKERTTRVYTRDGATEHFYSTESDVPFIDLRRGILETKLDKEIVDKDDVIVGDSEIHSLLKKHHQSIMDHIHFTIGETGSVSTSTSPSPPPAYAIENRWTLKAADTMGAWERIKLDEQGKGLEGTWALTIVKGRDREVNSSHPISERDRLYLANGRIEEMRYSLDAARGQWIDNYMELVTRETRDRWEGEGMTRRVDGVMVDTANGDEKQGVGNGQRLGGVSSSKVTDTTLALRAIEERLVDERLLMEKLLVYEIETWEGLVWNRVEIFMGRIDVPASEKERLTKEWRRNCWKRLDTNIRAMDARLGAARRAFSALPSNELQSALNSKLEHEHDELRRIWQSVIEGLADTTTPTWPPTPASRFQNDIRRHAGKMNCRYLSTMRAVEQERQQYWDMTCRLQKELADIEFRIAQGLDQSDQFWNDELVLKCRHSQAKSLVLSREDFKAPLDVYTRALQANNEVIYISCDCNSDEDYAWFAETIRGMPSVTSIKITSPESRRLPPIQHNTPLFIHGNLSSQSIETFLNNDRLLACSRETRVFLTCTSSRTIAVSFFGPSSGNLRLRLKHRARRLNTTITVPSTSLTLAIPETLTTDDITLHPTDSPSCPLFFIPNTRHNLVIQEMSGNYDLQDIQLIDKDGKPYGQPRH